MPKVKFTPKAPIDKLPLAVRKDIRDNYESKKADFESQIREILGVSFTLNINANEVCAYSAPESLSSSGSTFSGYVEGFISALKSYMEKHGEEGKKHFNDAVAQSELAIAVNPRGEEGDTISADVKDGVFRILFNPTRLGYNQSWLSDPLIKAIEEVPREGFSLAAKTGIDKDYTEEIDDLHEEIAGILAMPDLILDPNFEEVYAALSVKKETSWHANFGRTAFSYFEGLKNQLTQQGFKDDEMLQEGFAEVVTSKTFRLRIVKATKNGSTNEAVLEDGVIYLQTTPDRWEYNASYMGTGVLELL